MAKPVSKPVSRQAVSKPAITKPTASKPKASSRSAGSAPDKAACTPSIQDGQGREQVEIIIRRKLYGEAPQEKHFIVSDGRRLKNVRELIDALETMGDDVFSLHVNEFKNDFATWLRDVFSFEGMAQELERTKHRLEAQRVVMKNLINEIEEIAK